MDGPLYAHTPNEVQYYLMVTSCERCGRGPLAPRDPPPGEAAGQAPAPATREAAVRTRCKRCRHQRTFHFRWEYDVPGRPPGADCINPSPQPSRIVDLGQWVGLYSMFHDAAASAETPAEARSLHRQAALCLAEALKFHGEGELPPESAFFCDASKAAFSDNPAYYARTRLRELQALLPAPAAHGDDDAHGPPEPRRWWKFWGK